MPSVYVDNFLVANSSVHVMQVSILFCFYSSCTLIWWLGDTEGVNNPYGGTGGTGDPVIGAGGSKVGLYGGGGDGGGGKITLVGLEGWVTYLIYFLRGKTVFSSSP